MSGKIVLEKPGRVANTQLARGEYFVAVNVHAREFTITGNGMDIKVQGIRKESKRPIRRTEVVFYSGGGQTWTLLAKVPPKFELMAYVVMS